MAVMRRIERIAKRPELLTLFAMVFFADIAIGVARANFSLFASGLGASLAVVGALGGTEGLTRILVSVPIGNLSDRLDRQTVLGAGLLIFVVAFVLLGIVRDPLLLFPARALIAVGLVSTFFIGIAHVSDIVSQSDQGLAIGLYATCMGLGFAVGSALGGHVAESYGFAASFRVAAISALVSFSILWWGPSRRSDRPLPAAEASSEPVATKLALLVREPGILAACLGTLLISMAMEGAVFNFFPLYAASLGVGEAVIGYMLAARALSSTAVRLPAGALAGRFTGKPLMAVALAISMTAVMAIGFSTNPAMLSLLLACEGIGYGIFFSAGHTTVAEHTSEDNRGMATGLFVMAGSAGVAVGPAIMGPVAEIWGLSAVFGLASTALGLGLGVILWANYRNRDQ